MTRHKIEKRVNNILMDGLLVRKELIKPEADLVNDLGLDSLDMTELRSCIDKKFGIDVKSDYSNVETIKDLYDFVEEKAKNK